MKPGPLALGRWLKPFPAKISKCCNTNIFGILALGVGMVEWVRRAGKLGHWAWSVLLPAFALIGGGMLFLHMHGPHPAAHQIQIHHNVMGALALAGGLAWFAGEWRHQSVPSASSLYEQKSLPILKIIWSLAVIIIGVQLLFYSESYELDGQALPRPE